MQTATPQTMSQPMDQDNLDAGHGSGERAALLRTLEGPA